MESDTFLLVWFAISTVIILSVTISLSIRAATNSLHFYCVVKNFKISEHGLNNHPNL